jgi:hypothetical protein
VATEELEETRVKTQFLAVVIAVMLVIWKVQVDQGPRFRNGKDRPYFGVWENLIWKVMR